MELALWADLNLTPGTKARILCPYCNGGSSHEKSLSIAQNEDGSLWWRCFRASCGEMGNRNAHRLVSVKAKKAEPRVFSGPLAPLTESDYEYFQRAYGLDKDQLSGVRFAPEEDRYSFPILSPTAAERGIVLRSFGGLSPKALTFRTRIDDPFIGWYPSGAGVPRGPLVIVEDILSALKVQKAGGTAVSLNGTYINYQMATEIANAWYEGAVILALDKGTMPLMLRHKTKYDMLIGPIRIWKLEEDLKYERIESIREGLFNGKTDFGKAASSCFYEGSASV